VENEGTCVNERDAMYALCQGLFVFDFLDAHGFIRDVILNGIGWLTLGRHRLPNIIKGEMLRI
jgi:hypothetical protein